MTYLYIVLREADEIVCFVQSVGAFVCSDGLVNLMERSGTELLQFAILQGLRLSAQTGIDAIAVSLSRCADDIRELLAVSVHIRMSDSTQEGKGLCADLHVGLNEVLQESDIAAHVTERYHRSAVTDKGIVGIVPFRTERIHPYTCVRNEIRQFG